MMQVIIVMLCLLQLAPVLGRNKRLKNHHRRIAGCRYSRRKHKKVESYSSIEEITNRLMKKTLISSKMKMTIMMMMRKRKKKKKMRIAMTMMTTMMMMSTVEKSSRLIDRERINLLERLSGS